MPSSSFKRSAFPKDGVKIGNSTMRGIKISRGLMPTFIPALTLPDVTKSPYCMFIILCEAPSTTNMMVCVPRVPAVVDAAHEGKLTCLFPWPALQSLSCDAHIASVGLPIVSLAVKVYKPRSCNTHLNQDFHIKSLQY